MAHEFLFTGEVEPARGGTAGNDERAGVDPFLVVEVQGNVTVLRLETGHLRVLEARAETLGLGLHAHDKVGTIHSLGKTRKIFDQGCGRKLPAGMASFQDQR